MMALNLLNRLAIGFNIRANLQRYDQIQNVSTRLMSKKSKGRKHGNSPEDNKCGDNQFFGGCFKKETEFKCSYRKEKPKPCKDSCKDGPCKQGKAK